MLLLRVQTYYVYGNRNSSCMSYKRGVNITHLTTIMFEDFVFVLHKTIQCVLIKSHLRMLSIYIYAKHFCLCSLKQAYFFHIYMNMYLLNVCPLMLFQIFFACKCKIAFITLERIRPLANL